MKAACTWPADDVSIQLEEKKVYTGWIGLTKAEARDLAHQLLEAVRLAEGYGASYEEYHRKKAGPSLARPF